MAAATYDSVNSGSLANASTPFSITSPVASEAGDALIIAILSESTVTIGAPAGVTSLALTDTDNGKKLWTFKADNVGPSDSIGSFTRSGSSNIAWVIIAVNNADGSSSGSIVDDTGTTSYAADSTPAIATVTTTRNDQMAVVFLFVTTNQRTVTAWPASLSARATVDVGAAAGLRAATRQGIASGTNITGTATLSGNDTGGGISLTLKPRPMEGAASLAGTASLTSGGVRTKLGAASLAGIASITADGVLSKVGEVLMSGVASLAAAGIRVANGISTLAGQASLSAAANMDFVGEATLSGQAALTASGQAIFQAAANLAGVATLTADQQVIRGGEATLSGVATLTAGGNRVREGFANLAGVATLTAGGLLIMNGAANLSAVATLTAAARKILNGAAVLLSEATLTAIAVRLRYSVGISADGQAEDRYTVTVNLTQDHITAITKVLGSNVRIKAQVSSTDPRYKVRIIDPDPDYRVRID